ncbi:MAG: AraC family transcriptional regulator [Deltaproteobacteria bacterium]|nr:MAG: AraC family transcriptional regulator [Deltaproteobacteria bacterium]
MKTGKDIKTSLPGLTIIHHNLPGKSMELHKHFESHLFIPLKGSLSIKTEGQELKASPGAMIYVPKDLYHSFQSEDVLGERLICYLDQKKLLKILPLESRSAVKIKTNQLLKEMLFYLLSREQQKSNNTYVNLIYELLAESLETGGVLTSSDLEKRASASGDKRAALILKYFEVHHCEDVRVLDVAKESGMSSRTLNRVCMEFFGLGPKEILMLYRMESAIRLLSDKNKNVTDVAYSVGFNHLGSFIQAFTKYTGKLPSDWKRR